MIMRSIALTLLALVAHTVFANDVDPPCRQPEFPCDFRYCDCTADLPFSADNVHLVSSFAAAEGPGKIEFQWHEAEPIVFMLSHQYAANGEASPGRDLVVWEYGKTDYKSVTTLVHSPFTQLELTSDVVIGGTSTGSLLFWDIENEEFVDEVSVSDGEVSELLLHPSNEWLLAVIDEADLFTVDLESRSVSRIQLSGFDASALHTLSFSSDGRLLAVGANKMISIWDSQSWKQYDAIGLFNEPIADLLFTKDDSQLIALAGKSISRWNFADQQLSFGSLLKALPERKLCHLTHGDISPDDSLLMTTDDCLQLRAWDLTADTEISVAQLDYFEDSEKRWTDTSVEFSPDGLYLAEAGRGWALLFMQEAEEFAE